jgi:ribonuclease/clavin/mitogillin
MLYFRYHSTNCFFVRSSIGDRLLAIDAGWPGTRHEHAQCMKQIGCRFHQISWAIVTHFHMDHAGLVGQFLEQGITCFVFENQLGTIDSMEKTIEKNDRTYKRIQREKLVRISTKESRRILESIGVKGQVVVTDYHSPDSVTFVSDEGEAIIGDLPPVGLPDDQHYLDNWEIVRRAGAKVIYPSHAEVFRLDEQI